MTSPELARQIAKQLDSVSDLTPQRVSDSLRSMADQLDSLQRAVELINEDCMRLVKERDQLRQQISELKAKQNERRAKPRG
jgi:chorismate mutase